MRYSLSKSQVYNLSLGARRLPVYCHMGDFGCGGGGWTLALKMDGSKVDSFREEILPKVTPSNDLLPLPYVLLSLFLQLLFYGSFRFISFQAYFLRY